MDQSTSDFQEYIKQKHLACRTNISEICWIASKTFVFIYFIRISRRVLDIWQGGAIEDFRVRIYPLIFLILELPTYLVKQSYICDHYTLNDLLACLSYFI